MSFLAQPCILDQGSSSTVGWPGPRFCPSPCSETGKQTEHKITAEHQVQLRLMPVQCPATCDSCPHPRTTTEMHKLYPWLLSSKLERHTNVSPPFISTCSLTLLGLTFL